MKKLTDSRRKWFAIRMKSEEKKKLKRRKSFTQSERNVFHFVYAPEGFSLSKQKDRKKLTRFLSKLRGACKEDSQVTVDFTHTKRITAEATLLVYAEIHRILNCVDGVVLNGVAPKNNTAAQAMKKVGLLKMLKTSLKYRKEAENKNVANWNSAYGEDVDGEKSDSIISAYNGVIAESLTSELYKKITEAMTNVSHHAYIEERYDGLSFLNDKKPWWIFSQELDGYLTVAFCDLGIGIPRSLPIRRPNVWEKIKSWGESVKDSTVIYEAIRDSKTRTGQSYRGKGLNQIVETVRSFDTGAVRIYSNKGCYVSEKGIAQKKDYTDSILGTVISWRVPLPIERAA